MSHDLLQRLRDTRAFDQSPASEKLAAVHVPFDQLVAGTGVRYEERFAAAVRRGERIALIGGSGSGKSSITEYVMRPPGPRRIAPLRIRLGMQADDMQTDPAAFPRLLVSAIAKQLEPVKRVREIEQAVLGGNTKRAKKISVGGGFGWLAGSLAVEIGSLIAEPPRGADVIDRAVDILELIRRDGFNPTLVLDDTDQWIRRPGIDNPEARIASFFGTTVRLIAERLPAACVIAVHTEYLNSHHYEAAREFLDTRIALPALPEAASMGTIAEKRARVTLDDSTIAMTDFVEHAALSRLFDNYLAVKSVRRQMSVLHGATVRACDDGADVVAAQHVMSEIAA